MMDLEAFLAAWLVLERTIEVDGCRYRDNAVLNSLLLDKPFTAVVFLFAPVKAIHTHKIKHPVQYTSSM